jgi:hypothetical protein
MLFFSPERQSKTGCQGLEREQLTLGEHLFRIEEIGFGKINENLSHDTRGPDRLSLSLFLVSSNKRSHHQRNGVSGPDGEERTYGCHTTTSISEDTSSPLRKEPMISKLTSLSTHFWMIKELREGPTVWHRLESLFNQVSVLLDLFSGNHQFHFLVISDREL